MHMHKYFGNDRFCQSLLNICMCVFVSVAPHILSLKQVLAAFIAAGVRYHLWVDTCVISAG